MKLMVALVPNSELEKELVKDLIIYKRFDAKHMEQFLKDQYLKLDFPNTECTTGFEFMGYVERYLPNFFIRPEEPTIEI